MDISQSSLSGYKTDKKGVSRFSSDRSSNIVPKNTKEASSSSGQELKQINLKEGQFIHGEIVDHRYNEIKIKLIPGNQMITARVSDDIPVLIGQTAEFQVTDNLAGSVVLKYIPTESESGADAMILKALSASGLMPTDNNKSIVQELLAQNMPIDKQTLQTIVKNSHKNREASLQTIVLMFKYKIPITPENIRQFELYQKGTNQLLQDIKTVTGNITNILLSSKTRPNVAIDIPVSTMTESLQASSDNELLSSGLAQPADQNIKTNDTLGMVKHMQNTANSIIDFNSKLIHILYPEQVEFMNEFSVIQSNQIFPDLPPSVSPGTQENQKDVTLNQILTPVDRTKLQEYFDSLPITEPMKEEITNGTIGLKQLLTYINKYLPDSSATLQLLQSPEYGSLLQHALLKRWTVSPEDIAQKTPLQELYQNLQEDAGKLIQLYGTMKDEESSQQLREPLKHLKENVSFLKDFNEMFTFLQLPVGLKDRNLHSELYVFTRKKALQNNPDSLSVLLHLDMDHLGPLNIYLEMKPNMISAKFYTDDPESVQLIDDNLSILEQALHKKGYQIYSEVVHSYKEPDFIKDFIAQDNPESSVKRFTFDIRT